MSKDRNLLDRLMALGEDRLEQFLQDVVNNPSVTAAFGDAAERVKQARDRAESNFKDLLSAASIPDSETLAALTDRIADLETAIVDLGPRIQALANRNEAKRGA